MRKILFVVIFSLTVSNGWTQDVVSQSIPLDISKNTGLTVSNKTTYGTTLSYTGSSIVGCEATIPINALIDIAPLIGFKIDLQPNYSTSNMVYWGYTINLIGIDNIDSYYASFRFRRSSNKIEYLIVWNTPNSGYKVTEWTQIKQIPETLSAILCDNDLTFLQEWAEIDTNGGIISRIHAVGNIKGIKSVTLKMEKGMSLRVQNPTIAVPPQYVASINKKPTSGQRGEYFASGSGFVIATNGIIITNYHVVDGAKGIDIFVNRSGEVKTYNAQILISDKTNDISILKINDKSFTNFTQPPYAVKTSILDVGTSVFALGYPMSDILGEEIKVTDGIISSKTGYQGDVVTYQISAPIQHGNSGGPLFDKQGNLVGITNSGVPDAQNVGYAIKTTYLRNLIDVAPMTITLPANNTIAGLTFTEKIKRLTPYVVLIKIY